LLVGLLGLTLVISCGGGSGGGGGDTTNYTISGKVGTVSARGGRALSDLSVTNIVAIASTNHKYSATLDSDGNFTIKVKSGYPYAVGFYNQTGTTITLLGYLRQDQVDWHSLPLMDPATTTTNLGTIEIDTTSIEAIPSIGLNDLLSNVNMDLATANLYGEIDGMMTQFTNVDVDGNGVFDFLESKAFMLDVIVQIGKSNGLTSGELALMQDQWYENYYAIPNSYQFFFYATEGSGGSDKPAAGTPATLRFPQMVYDMVGNGKTAIAGFTAIGYGWSVSTFEGSSVNSSYVTPEVVPSGSYTYEVSGRANYTFHNIQGSAAVAVGLTENVIYPVMKLTTSEAGKLATVYYKWMIRVGTTTREATLAEIRALIADSDLSEDCFVQTSPTISVETNDGVYHPPIKLARNEGESTIDLSSWNVSVSDITKIVVGYCLSTNLDCRYYFFQ